MFTVVLTGGIASGKSTASAIFEQLGIQVIDADVVSRELVEPGQPALQRITEHFGSDLLDAHGRLDRARLRERVFNDPPQRRALENILHPLIHQRMLELAAAADSPYVVMVVPLLLESEQDYPHDRVLLIDVPEQLQVQRVQARDHCSAQQARQILSAQTSREQRRAHADDIVVNDGDTAQLQAAIKKLHHRYLSLSD